MHVTRAGRHRVSRGPTLWAMTKNTAYISTSTCASVLAGSTHCFVWQLCNLVTEPPRQGHHPSNWSANVPGAKAAIFPPGARAATAAVRPFPPCSSTFVTAAHLPPPQPLARCLWTDQSTLAPELWRSRRAALKGGWWSDLIVIETLRPEAAARSNLCEAGQGKIRRRFVGFAQSRVVQRPTQLGIGRRRTRPGLGLPRPVGLMMQVVHLCLGCRRRRGAQGFNHRTVGVGSSRPGSASFGGGQERPCVCRHIPL